MVWISRMQPKSNTCTNIVHVIIIVSIEASVSRAIHCFLGNIFVKGLEILRKTDDVIHGRILFREAFLFNQLVHSIIEGKIDLLWNKKLRNGENPNPCGLMLLFLTFATYLAQNCSKLPHRLYCNENEKIYINREINKLTSVFYASVLLLMINCFITLEKWLWKNEPQKSGS